MYGTCQSSQILLHCCFWGAILNASTLAFSDWLELSKQCFPSPIPTPFATSCLCHKAFRSSTQTRNTECVSPQLMLTARSSLLDAHLGVCAWIVITLALELGVTQLPAWRTWKERENSSLKGREFSRLVYRYPATLRGKGDWGLKGREREKNILKVNMEKKITYSEFLVSWTYYEFSRCHCSLSNWSLLSKYICRYAFPALFRNIWTWSYASLG